MVCRNSSKIRRHNAVLRALAAAARLANIGTSFTSVLGLCRRPGETCKKQPDVVFDEFHDAASPSLLDGCVTDPTALSHSNLLYESVGAAAAVKERAKSAKYLAMAERMGFHFSAFGIESWGAWGPAATRVLQRIVQHRPRRLAQPTRCRPSGGARRTSRRVPASGSPLRCESKKPGGSGRRRCGGGVGPCRKLALT